MPSDYNLLNGSLRPNRITCFSMASQNCTVVSAAVSGLPLILSNGAVYGIRRRAKPAGQPTDSLLPELSPRFEDVEQHVHPLPHVSHSTPSSSAVTSVGVKKTKRPMNA